MNGLKILIWVAGCLTLIGIFIILAVATNSFLWACMAIGTFAFGYFALMIGICAGWFD